MKGIKYTAREKEKALRLWLVDGKDILWVAKKTKCSERSLWRWKRLYDGELESLANHTSRPHTPHPNAHTDTERTEIINYFTEHPDIGYSEAYGDLRVKFAYSRTYGGFYRYVVKNNLRGVPVAETVKRENKPYDTPQMLGVKWQMDVKYVPRECNKGQFPEEWYYQYTIIDEATRERFLYPYKEKSGYSTVDFVQRAIIFFGYIPQTIQTDNGCEFTNPKGTGDGKVHILDKRLAQLGIKHQLIRPYTPRHNGKVERSHRTDVECFYSTLQFKTYDELKEKMQAWNVRYNNKPHSAIRDRNGKKRWQTPAQKRVELLADLKATGNALRIRFIKLRA